MVLCKTPLRVSFFGGGTDFPAFFKEHGGAVLGTTIDKYIYHSVLPFVSSLFDYNIRIAYREVECVRNVEDIRHTPFKEVLKYAGIEKDIEISMTSNLPSFSGLGSSSSFVVGLLNSIYAYQGKMVPRIELAYQAIDIEQNILKESVGCQDQVFAAVGGFSLIEFVNTNNINVHRVPLHPDRYQELAGNLLLYFTGIKRRASEVEKSKMQNIDKNREHMIEIRKLVDEAYKVLIGNHSLTEFGRLLDKTWKLKRGLDSKVSNNEIDVMYETATNAGAIGGKLLGAGGGGFMLFYVPQDKQQKVKEAMQQYPRINFEMNVSGSHIVHC